MMRINSSYDVLVAGGGMAGCAAAVAAARGGAKTLLLERYGYLGGWATAGLVNPFMSHRTTNGTPLIAGLYDEVLGRLAELGGLFYNSFDSEYLKYVLQEMVLESGSELLLHSWLEDARYMDTGSIALTCLSKSGRTEIECSRLIDCSGDGDAAASLGAQFQMGDERGLTQATTLMFDVGGVDLVRAMRYVAENPDQMRFPKLTPDADPQELAQDIISVAGYYDLVAQAREAGDYSAPGDLIFYIGRPQKGIVTFNTTHVGGVDGTNARDLTRAEIENRRQMISVLGFVRKYVPGFENAYLAQSAAHVGVRETRRIIGEYQFSEWDVVEARKFDDAICRLAYPVDVHSGKGDGYTKEEEYTGPQAPAPGDWYEIPFRCLVPKDLPNVLVAGRCVSSTQGGHGAIRIMPSCVAMGQAAGTAAAISLTDNTPAGKVDIGKLLDELRKQNALV